MIDFSKMEPGVPYPLNFFNVADGSYNIHFFHSLHNLSVVAVHVQEGSFGIVYWREKRGLFIPHPTKMDEESFAKFTKRNFGVIAGMNTQMKSKSLDLFFEGDQHFQKQNYQKAVFCYDKVLSSSDDNNQRRGLAHYKKALALIEMGNKAGAVIELDKAVEEDNTLSSSAKALLQKS